VSTFLLEATQRTLELEGPEEGIGLFETLPTRVDLMNEIFNANDTKTTEMLGDHGIVSDGNALTINFRMATLVDQFTHGLKIRITISDIRFNHAHKIQGSLVDLDEGAIENLTQTQKLQNGLEFGMNTIDTTNANDKHNFGFRLDKEIAIVFLLDVADGQDCVAHSNILFDVLQHASPKFSAKFSEICGRQLLWTCEKHEELMRAFASSESSLVARRNE